MKFEENYRLLALDSFASCLFLINSGYNGGESHKIEVTQVNWLKDSKLKDVTVLQPDMLREVMS